VWLLDIASEVQYSTCFRRYKKLLKRPQTVSLGYVTGFLKISNARCAAAGVVAWWAFKILTSVMQAPVLLMLSRSFENLKSLLSLVL